MLESVGVCWSLLECWSDFLKICLKKTTFTHFFLYLHKKTIIPVQPHGRAHVQPHGRPHVQPHGRPHVQPHGRVAVRVAGRVAVRVAGRVAVRVPGRVAVRG